MDTVSFLFTSFVFITNIRNANISITDTNMQIMVHANNQIYITNDCFIQNK